MDEGPRELTWDLVSVEHPQHSRGQDNFFRFAGVKKSEKSYTMSAGEWRRRGKWTYLQQLR